MDKVHELVSCISQTYSINSENVRTSLIKDLLLKEYTSQEAESGTSLYDVHEGKIGGVFKECEDEREIRFEGDIVNRIIYILSSNTGELVNYFCFHPLCKI